MKKLIVIGQSRLEVKINADLQQNQCSSASLMFDVACAATDLIPTIFISEIGNDAAGDVLMNMLAEAQVDYSHIDRLASATTPLRLSTSARSTDYNSVAEDDGRGLDIVWPRIERGDVVAFGGYFSLDSRLRQSIWQLLSAAEELGAKLVYIPDMDDCRITRVTKIMPLVFENLEIASAVIASPKDLEILYQTDDAARAFKNNLSFYCNQAAVVKADGSTEAFGMEVAASGVSTAPRRIAHILAQL